MSDANLQVKIKSHSGGRLQHIHGTSIAMAEDEDEYICNIDAVIIHAGTNNLSDGDSGDHIVKQYKNVAETIKQINPECHIIISSILPWKSDKLANKVITQTNQSLKQLCDSSSFFFLDNTENFISNGETNTTLYKDNFHLNAKGGKELGEAICDKIRNILKLPAHSAQTSSRQEQNFRNGRIPGRRMFDNVSNTNNSNRVSNNNRNNNNRNNSSSNNSSSNNNSSNSSNNNSSNNRNNNRNNNNLSQPMMNNQSPMMYMPIPFFQPPWFSHNQMIIPTQ